MTKISKRSSRSVKRSGSKRSGSKRSGVIKFRARTSKPHRVGASLHSACGRSPTGRKRSGIRSFNDITQFFKTKSEEVKSLLNDIEDRINYEKEHENWASSMYHQKCDHLLFELEYNFKVDIDKVKKTYDYGVNPTKKSCDKIINAFQNFDIIKADGTPQDKFIKIN